VGKSFSESSNLTSSTFVFLGFGFSRAEVVFLGFGFSRAEVVFLGFGFSPKTYTSISAGCPPRPKIPFLPVSIILISRFSRSSFRVFRASSVASSTVLPLNIFGLISFLLIVLIIIFFILIF